MDAVVGALPLLAAVLAVPQFVPQLLRLRRTGSWAGVSWAWAALTSVNNAAWLVYFAMSELWSALVPAISATVLAGVLAVALARRSGGVPTRPALLTAGWATLLAVTTVRFGLAGLGVALTAAFLLQVTPSVISAYRSADTSGVSPGTWWLIFGELLCWEVFGVAAGDPRLTVLGASGVTASVLVLSRLAYLAAARRRHPAMLEPAT